MLMPPLVYPRPAFYTYVSEDNRMTYVVLTKVQTRAWGVLCVRYDVPEVSIDPLCCYPPYCPRLWIGTAMGIWIQDTLQSLRSHPLHP